MNNPTKLLPTDLIAVEVPKDATQIQVWNHGIGFKAESIKSRAEDTNGFFHLHTGLGRWYGFKILGEVTEDSISFDVEPYVEKITINDQVRRYPNYCINSVTTGRFSLWSSSYSFRSLLQANGLSWVNEIEKPNKEYYIFEEHPELVGNPKEYDNEAYENDLQEWQEAEIKKLKGKLIILKEIK